MTIKRAVPGSLRLASPRRLDRVGHQERVTFYEGQIAGTRAHSPQSETRQRRDMMSVVAAVLYRNGKRVRDIDATEKVHCPDDRSEFVWIGLLDPTPEDLRALQGQYGLHPLAVEDAISGKQMPRVDVYHDQLFVTARTAELVGDEIRYGEVAIFVGHSHIITVRHGHEREFSKLRDQLEQAPGMLQKGVDYVLQAILDHIVDGYLPIIETIQDDTLVMERRTIDSFLGRDEVIRIFSLRREIIRFQRVLIPMSEVAAKFLIPSPINQNPCAHWRKPMVMMRQGCSTSLFQAKQQ